MNQGDFLDRVELAIEVPTDTFDCHIHTKVSDGLLTPAQAIAEGVMQKLEWVICTDHDAINKEFTAMASASGIKSMPGVEVSSFDGTRPIHCLVYSNEFSYEFNEKLNKVHVGKFQIITQKLDKLRGYGFECDIDEFIAYWLRIEINLFKVSNAHIAHYLFPEEKEYKKRREFNLKRYKELTGNNYELTTFIRRHMRCSGDQPFGAVSINAIHPKLTDITSGSDNEKTVKSIAHPHLNYADIGAIRFADHAIRLIRSNVIQGIEVSALVSPEWIEAYKFVRKSTNCILTFGSDCHFAAKKPGQFHRWIGKLNTDIGSEQKKQEFERLLEATGH